MKQNFNRLLSAFLVLCLMLGMMAPVAASASEADSTASTEPTVTATTASTVETSAAVTDSTTTAATEAAAPLAEEEGSVKDYATFLAQVKVLEVYAKEYAAISGKDAGELLLNFLRTGVDRYNDGNWLTLAGQEITDFKEYVAGQDAAKGTTVMDLKNVEEFTIPNGQGVDFGHMFGTMNISYINSAVATDDLSGWAGDVCDLMIYSKDYGTVPAGTVDEMAAYILENCFGVDADDAFGMDDFYGDMDGFYLVAQLQAGKSFSETVESYFTAALSNEDRAAYFLNNRFKGTLTQEAVRTALYEAYAANIGVQVLEADRGLSEDNDLRMASCYALADYLFSLAEDRLEGGEEPTDPTDPSTDPTEPSADPTEPTAEPENPYYSVFSSSESVLAPGITQKIEYAYTADDKQIVYYLATVDVTREDVTIMANYKDNDPSTGWGMQRVMDQALAIQKNHSDPASDKYIENFQVVVATNGDGFNMSTGKPGGLLVMEGVEWHPVDGDGFFAILKDGSAMIGTKADYDANKDKIQEAIGAFGATLVKNGEIAVNRTENYYSSRASRTAIGITAEGKVVMMVLDGRQEPFSAGGSMQEIAQIMLEAGCVEAINLDGGGSTTFVARPEGSEDLQVINRPSDGYARSVSATLVAVSTAVVSNEFHHANISSEYDYLTVGTSLEMTAVGVSDSGNAAQIPENAVWTVSDPSIGSVENGVFTALDNGEVEVQLTVDGAVVGSKTVHVVIPDTLSFTKETMSVIYGVPTKLPLLATYNGNTVKFNPDDIFAGGEYEEAGIFEGDVFTADESSGIRKMLIAAFVVTNEETFCAMEVRMYKNGEAVFDFDDVTAGDRTLAWDRDVSNSTAEDKGYYHVSDPEQTMDITYVFGLDMSSIEIPEELADIIYMLPGADTGATAWDFLLQLAERVSVLTEVKVTAQFDKNLELDISNLTLVNEYFKFHSAQLDEQTNTLTITAKWVDQTAAIDASTANPICILSGIKATPKADAEWDANNCLAIVNSGEVTYNIYLRASSLYSFAQNPANQQKYQLYPFENPDVIIGGTTEKGASFGSTYATFEDAFTLDNTNRQGWYSNEGGNNLYYYVNNKALTGIQLLPGYEDASQKLYYSFEEDGSCVGAITGLFELNGELHYAIMGEGKTGWQEVITGGVSDTYYFDPATGAAVDGEQTIGGYTYTFTDHILTRGQICTNETGIRYRWAGTWPTKKWLVIDGKEAYASFGGYFLTGPQSTYYTDGIKYYFAFGADGFWMKDHTGFFDWEGKTYWVEDGFVNAYPGLVLVDGDYYYFNSTGTMVKDCSYWISKGNGYLKNGRYNFGPDGKLLLEGETPDPTTGSTAAPTTAPTEPIEKLNGIVKESEDVWYYYVDGVKTYAGLILIDGDYYYVNSKCLVIHGCDYWISKNNGHMRNQMYTFDADGKMIVESGTPHPTTAPAGTTAPSTPTEPVEKLNGIVKESEDTWYYYVDGVKTYAGLILIDGDYYYVNSKCLVIHGCDYWISKNNGHMRNQMYTFDAEGKMVMGSGTPNPTSATTAAPTTDTTTPDPTVPSKPEAVLNGIVRESADTWYYYVSGKKTYAGLVQYTGNAYDAEGNVIEGVTYGEGDYIYVNGSCEVVHDCDYWVYLGYGIIPNGSYPFDADGKLVLSDDVVVSKPNGSDTTLNGIVKESEDVWYYYVDGVKTYAGLIVIDGYFYYVNSKCQVVHDCTYWISKNNGYMRNTNYTFDAEGRMVDPPITIRA